MQSGKIRSLKGTKALVCRNADFSGVNTEFRTIDGMSLKAEMGRGEQN